MTNIKATLAASPSPDALHPAIDEQPNPIINNGPSMHDLVIADLKERKALGLKRYGAPLQANNGRKALVDAYQEILDLAVYIRQELSERYQEQASEWSGGPNTSKKEPENTHPSDDSLGLVRVRETNRLTGWGRDPKDTPVSLRTSDPYVKPLQTNGFDLAAAHAAAKVLGDPKIYSQRAQGQGFAKNAHACELGNDPKLICPDSEGPCTSCGYHIPEKDDK